MRKVEVTKMNKKYLVTALAILPLFIFHSLTYAGTFTAFEPKTFVRGSGTPVAETTSFSIKNPNTTYPMHIYNGGYDSEYSSVSSAVITLNGTAIFTTSDFNQKVAHLQKEITLSIYNNLQVDLRSSPASAVTIIIEGVDNTPPLIDISLPVNNSYLNAPSITVTGNADDAISWISQVTVNGAIAPISNGTYSLPINLNPVPSFTNNPQLVISGTVTDASPLTSFTINGTPVTVTSNAFSAMLNLLEGDNTLIISATDMAGNIGTA